MKRMHTPPAGMILLVLSVVPQVNGQTYEEEVLSDEPVVYYRFEETERIRGDAPRLASRPVICPVGRFTGVV